MRHDRSPMAGVWKRALRTALLAATAWLAAATGAQAQQAWPQVPSEPMRAAAAVDKRFSARSAQFASAQAPGLHRALPPVTAAELRRVQALAPRAGHKAERVGFARELAAFDQPIELGRLSWLPQPDGSRVAKLTLTSPGALGLRVAIDREPGRVAHAVLIRAAGSAEPALVEGPMDARDFAQPRFYSAFTAGESITLEFQLPAALARVAPGDLGLRIAELTHFDRDFLRLSTNKAAQGTCYRDIACEAQGGAEETISRAVARYIYSNSQGTFTCTGTLMNDADATTQIQHFLSANHCIDTAAEAASMTTFWWDQNTTCGGTVRSANYVQLTGGADIQAKHQPLDMILLRLRGTAPASAILAGWSAAPMSFVTATAVIHHPGGDRKKISRANANAFSGYFQGTSDTHVRVIYTQSSTEGGSSGSGLFTLASGGGYQLRGTLSGGDALCTNPSGFDYFGRLDRATDIVAILNRQGTTPAITPETGWYWDDTAGGQGFGIEILNGRLFIGGFLYDAQGNPIWFVANGALAANGTDFVADMQEWQGGQTLTGSYRPPTQIASPGTINLSWTSNTQLVMRWPGGLKTLKRYPIPGGPGAAAGPSAGMPQRGWWWNAGEAGRGYMLEVQGSQLFMTGFMYLVNGYRTWYLTTGGMTGTSVYQGTWQQYGFGQTYTSGWVSPTLINVNAGFVRLDFTSTTTAVLTLPNGATVNLVRFTNF